jgi:hypothetical protein
MNVGFQKIGVAGLLAFTLLWILAGCTQMGEVGERPRKGPSYYEHKVKWKGESLSIIAQWYTGNAENWTVLAKINPGIDPIRIQMGERVRIPENLMKTKKPMPKSFISDGGKKRPEAPPSKPQPPPPDEEPQLFGPKPYPKE